jgi:transcription-repair coupling factor (superfamily II helicase)
MHNTTQLLQTFSAHPAVADVCRQLARSPELPPVRLELTGLSGAGESFVLASVLQQQAKTATPAFHLFIANAKEEAAYRFNDLEGLLPAEQTWFFPDSFKRPSFFDDIHATQVLQRSETISKLTAPGVRSGVVVTYPEALFEKVVRPEVLAQSRIEITKGEQIDADFMIETLVEYGFERADFVFEPGQFSIRGGIIDLFSYGNELPYRIELFDKEVETLRIFDPLTQLSKRNLEKLSIVPNLNTRFRQDQKVSLFQIIPPGTTIWIKDYQFLLDRLQYCFERAETFASKLTALDAAELRELFRDRAFLYPGEVLEDIAEKAIVFL